eukprot:TRINITY_DN17526_c2_g1_i1.p2 TRINITY_DN17526_c2_g1~~TRINITY_DN17526_c2_g1_i1.p2  ORF type:complete len:526 (-),score=129.89 TRINITY_DN17526_c2_g1_i1:446-2023(-)
MSRVRLLALLLGVLLVVTPKVTLADEEDYEDDFDEDDDEAPDADDSEKDVVVLTDSTFDDVISKAKYALVEFYAPWCGHCKALAPEYAKAATTLKAYDPEIIIAKVDATAETKLAEKYEVRGYPTLKWFVDGEALEYGGGRDEETIVRWIKKKTGPAAATVDSAEDVKKVEEDNEVVVVGYFKSFKGDSYDAFIAAARKTEDAAFLQTTEAAAAAAVDLKKPGVALVKNFEGEERQVVALEGSVTEESVSGLVKSEKLPLIIPFTDKSGEKIFGSGIDRQVLIIGGSQALKSNDKMLREAAADYKGEVIYVTADTDGDFADPVVQFFGLDADEKTKLQVVGFLSDKNKKFSLEEEVTLESVKAFTKGLVEGTLQPRFKSEPVPENNIEDNVVVIVGKTFDEIVKDPTKDVLVEAYAPWCGHCKKLAPIYSKLGKRFQKVDSVVIAKMDATANEHGDMEVQGFPTLKFFPACDLDKDDDCEVVEYEGERTLKDMTKFIKKNARVEYELPKKKKGEESSEDEKHEEL